MKIFNRGNDAAKPPSPSGPAAAVATVAPHPQAAPPAPAPQAHAPAPAPAPAAPAAPDITAILDANVKEMSEKISRLTSSLEGAQKDRQGFEAKIEQMEERMRKLSSLTEMISAQYNPFVGDAPAEREPLPAPEVGLAQPVAMPPLPVAAPPAAAPAPLEAPPFALSPSLASALSIDAPPSPYEDAPMMEPEPMPAPPAPVAAPPAQAAPPQPPQPDTPNGVHLWAAAPSFESSMLMLGWADMLLKATGSREAVVSLASYYHNVGWIGDPARDQLLAYADGLAAPHAGAEGLGDWRAGADVHERSLLFVEKLKSAAGRRTA